MNTELWILVAGSESSTRKPRQVWALPFLLIQQKPARPFPFELIDDTTPTLSIGKWTIDIVLP